jgi:hypothetical protein
MPELLPHDHNDLCSPEHFCGLAEPDQEAVLISVSQVLFSTGQTNSQKQAMIAQLNKIKGSDLPISGGVRREIEGILDQWGCPF